MPNKDLTFNFFGRDVTLGDTLHKISAQGAAQAKAFDEAFGKVPKIVTLATVGAIAATAVMAAKFQSSMTLLETAGGESAKNIGLVSSGILDMAVKTGTSTTALAEGMYTVEKAGIRGADGLKVLKAAAEGAKAENVDLGTATNALTSVMMSYHMHADKAVQVENMLVAASGMSKTTMQEFAGSLAAVIPVASSAGIGFDQVGGAIATLTQHGTSAQEATQELANTIRSLQAPNHVAASEMQQLGINVTDLSQHLGSRGLTGTIQLVEQAIAKNMGPAGLVVMNTMKQSQAAANDAKIMFDRLPSSIQDVAKAYMTGDITQKQWRATLKGMDVDQRQLAMQFAATVNQSRGFNDLMKSGNPAAQTFAGALNKIMGGATGMNTALMLGGENMAYFKKATEDIGAAGRKTGQDISTWKATQSTLTVATDQAKASMQVLGITLGTALLPPATAVMRGVAGITTALMNNKPVLYGLLGVLGAFAAVMTTVYVAQKAFQAAMVLQKAAIIGATVVQWAWNVALDANPIGIIIVAIGALVAGLIWFFTQTSLGKTIWKGFVTFLGDAWTWLHDYVIVPVVNAISVAITWLYNNAIRPYVGLIVLEVKLWAAITTWLYENAIKPTFTFIGQGFTWIYNYIIKPYVQLIVFEVQAWAAVFTWLYQNGIQPTFQMIGNVFSWLWNDGIKPIIGIITDAIHNLGKVFGAVFGTIGNVIQGALSGIGQVTSALGNASGLAAIPIKAHAGGGMVMPGELSLVGERGPELVKLPGGSRVYPTGTGPQQQSGGLHIGTLIVPPGTSVAQFAQELGWRAKWAT